MSLSVEKCIELSTKAKTDNERMAVMLLIAKHSDASKFSLELSDRFLDREVQTFFF